MPSALAHPERLLLLVVVAGLAAAYLTLQLRRAGTARAWSDDALRTSTAPRRPGPLRHLGPVLLLGGLTAMTVGFAEPHEQVEVERERALVVLALDTSASMLAQDVAPDRFTAAKEAAIAFADGLPDGFDLALVGFAGTTSVLVPPTDDAEAVTRAIAGLELAGGTALGDAVQSAVAAAAARPEEVPAAVVLLADGGSTIGSPVEDGISAAVGADVPVHTIAYGTPQGRVELAGRTYDVPVDEAVLARIADATGGRAYKAATGEQLREVYGSIRARLSTSTEEQDVSGRFAGVALLLLAAAAVPAVLRPRLG